MIIYKITNIVTNKFYIGSSVCFKQRKKQHIDSLNDNTHHNYKLQRDWNLYKEHNFKFELIEKGYRNKQSLLLREYELINSLKDCYYNIDRICPIIKENKPKHKKNNFNIHSSKNGTFIFKNKSNKKEGKITIVNKDNIVKKKKNNIKVKQNKMNPIKDMTRLDKMIEAKKIREENKIRNRELLKQKDYHL